MFAKEISKKPLKSAKIEDVSEICEKNQQIQLNNKTHFIFHEK